MLEEAVGKLTLLTDGEVTVADLRESIDARGQLAQLRARLTASEAALGDCLMLARRRQRTDQVNEDWGHIIRFCDQAGVKPDGVLRQNQSSEAKRKWTRERPTVAGWYYFREQGEGSWEIVEIREPIFGSGLHAYFTYGRRESIGHLRGEFQGPLTPGEE